MGYRDEGDHSTFYTCKQLSKIKKNGAIIAIEKSYNKITNFHNYHQNAIGRPTEISTSQSIAYKKQFQNSVVWSNPWTKAVGRTVPAFRVDVGPALPGLEQSGVFSF